MKDIPSYSEKHGIFVKSLPDHGLGLNGFDKKGTPIVKQTIESIFSNLELQPNTRSFSIADRICFSHLFHEAGLPVFTESYRKSGVIFTYRDGDKADLFFPCDLLALTRLNDMPHDKDQLFANLHTYYQSKIIKDWKLFGTKSIEEWIERMHFTGIVSGKRMNYDELIMELINGFRTSFGYKPLSTIHHNWLVSHNECIKFTPLKINVLGVFGESNVLHQKAKEFGIPSYDSPKAFMKSTEE